MKKTATIIFLMFLMLSTAAVAQDLNTRFSGNGRHAEHARQYGRQRRPPNLPDHGVFLFAAGDFGLPGSEPGFPGDLRQAQTEEKDLAAREYLLRQLGWNDPRPLYTPAAGRFSPRFATWIGYTILFTLLFIALMTAIELIKGIVVIGRRKLAAKPR